MVFPKHVTWREEVNGILYSLVEGGMVKHLIRKYIKPRQGGACTITVAFLL